MTQPSYPHHVYMAYSRVDGQWVEELALRLREEATFDVWLDTWSMVPGSDFVPAMEEGLQSSATCAVCISDNKPDHWFEKEIALALHLQSHRESFRVIPVLSPGATDESAGGFLSTKTWADFRDDRDVERGFHVLCSGIRGVAPGPWPPRLPRGGQDDEGIHYQKLVELKGWRETIGISDNVFEEAQRLIVIDSLKRGGIGNQ